MCELFGISASAPARPDRLLRAFRLRGGLAADNPDDRGLASRDGDAFRIFKVPEPAARSAIRSAVRHAVLAPCRPHVRKARYPPISTKTNTHLFVPTCCGRQWVFAHNGVVPGGVDHGNRRCRRLRRRYLRVAE
jgi:glutamine amidotransferase